MAGHTECSLEEVHTLIDTVFLFRKNLILKHSHAQPFTSRPTSPNTPRPQNALITKAPSLELRQNNPQDCQNLIDASVDRATVEISRTIIRLNATFSQQLQDASISASNGIKSAQDSASSSIGIVVKSADIANSSAHSSITFVNRQVTSANLALTSAQSSANEALSSANLASSSDVARLSSSLNLLRASVTSLQASVSAAGNQPIPGLQHPPTFSLTPGQIAGIVVGSVAISVILSLLVYFTIMRMKKQQRDSYLDEKAVSRSPREMRSRMSSAFRTGNGITIKFNPAKSSDLPPPSRQVLRQEEDIPVESSTVRQIKPAPIMVPVFKGSDGGTSISVSPAWPLTATTSANRAVISFSRPTSSSTSTGPLNSAGLGQNPITTILPPSIKSPAMLLDPTPNSSEVIHIRAPAALSSPREVSNPGDVVADAKDVINPFDDFFSPLEEDIVLQNPFKDVIIDEIDKLVKDEDKTSIESVEEIHTGAVENLEWELLGQQMDDYMDDIPTEAQLAGPPVKQAPQSPRLPACDSVPEVEQSGTSTFPEIDTLIRLVANENGIVGKKPLFCTDFRSPNPEVKSAIWPPSLSKLLPPRQKTLSPLPRNSIQKDAEEIRPSEIAAIPTSIKALPSPSLARIEQIELPPSPTPSEERRDRTLSPLRRNPVSPIVLNERNTFSVSSNIPAVRSGALFPSKSPEEELNKAPSLQVQQNAIIDSAMVNTILIHSIMAPSESIPLQPIPPEARKVSPLRRKPHVLDMNYPLIENEMNAQPASEEIEEAPDPDDRQARGRSLIRTSDIIEARLSAIAQLQKDRKPMEILEARLSAKAQKNEEMNLLGALEDEDNKKVGDRTKSPLRRNPVDLAQIPAFSRNNTLSPLRQNPSTSTLMKRRSRTLSPALTSHHLPNPVPDPISREDSPLRRNPLNALPLVKNPNNTFMDPALGNRVRVTSNALFAQSLSKFQTLANQNPQDAMLASNEVTSRAIAGIYIPGSLREQAVRNLSKSRERWGGRSE